MRNFICITFIIFIVPDGMMARKRHIGPCLLVTEPEDCPDPDYIHTYLFTRWNEDEGQYVEFTETTDNATSSKFNSLNPNKLIIHGFNADMDLDVLQNIKTEYLKQCDANIWVVNYPKLVEGPSLCYPFAVQNIKHVGRCLAQVIRGLRRHNSSDIHVIGFSLGAQVTNYIARELGDEKLERITGLDPAGPLFTWMDKKYRLDSSDAKFVDVIHTNGLIQGDIERCGHIDFYMNGGIFQPGCFADKSMINCDHRRAPQYFAESINSKTGFFGWPCTDYTEYLEGRCKPTTSLVLMGEHCQSGSSGFYIAHTAAEQPFALGNRTDECFHKRATKMGFTKIPKKSNNSTVTENNPLQKLFPEVCLV